jgi:hypothetical protein
LAKYILHSWIRAVLISSNLSYTISPLGRLFLEAGFNSHWRNDFMQQLTVKNFLTLKDISLDIPKINIIIGPQAEGKSLLAKLTYFFKTFVRDFRNAIVFKETRREFDRRIVKKFDSIFPHYTWENTKFEIEYTFDSRKIAIYSNNSRGGKINLTIEYSASIKQAFESLKSEYSESGGKKVFVLRENSPEEYLEAGITQLFAYDQEYDKWEQTIFMPSGRAFLAALQKAGGKAASSNVADLFLREFGAMYERAKNFYSRSVNGNSERIHPEVQKVIEDILHGKYIHDNNEDWIHTPHNKTSFSDSSFGQQEALPMSLVLSFLTSVSNQANPYFVLIEEPEAHLFPTSQKKVVELISLTYRLSHRSTNFFITTHSPYILTAFNNLIQAYDTFLALRKSGKENRQELIAKLYKTVPQDRFLPFDDIAVFSICDGQLEDVKDYDSKIINAHKIDDVSSELNETFGDLVALQFEVE